METTNTAVTSTETPAVAGVVAPSLPALTEEAILALAAKGPVSVKDLVAAKGGAYDCTIATASKYLNAAVEAGKLARSTETRKVGGRGRPMFLFVLPTDPKAAPKAPAAAPAEAAPVAPAVA